MICIDFSSSINLHDSRLQTQADARQFKKATLFGVVRYYRDTSTDEEKKRRTEEPAAAGLRMDHYLYLSEGEHSDSYYALAALQHFAADAVKARGVKELTIWSDNGSGFHSGEFVNGMQALSRSLKLDISAAFFAPGEGKSDNDR